MLGVRRHDIEHIGFLGFEHALDRRGQVFFVMDPLAGDSEAFAKLDIVRVDALQVLRIAEEGVPAISSVEAVLPLHDHAEVLVVQNDCFRRDALDVGCGELLDIHQKRSVTIDVDHLFVRHGDFRAHRCGVAESHGSQPGRGDEGAGLVEIIKLPGPHLVLTHAGGDDRLAFRHLMQESDDMLWLDGILGVLEAERVLLFPAIDLGIPIRIARVVFGYALLAGLIQDFVEAAEGVFEIAEDRQANGLVFVDLGIVDVDVNDGSVLTEFLHLAGHAVIETHADGEQKVGFVHGIVGVNRAVHAEPFQRERVRLGETSDAHERGGHGHLGALGKFEEFLRS